MLASMADRHLGNLSDMQATNLNVECIFTNTIAITIGTRRIATISSVHDAHVHLVELGLDIFEEGLYAFILILPIPNQILDLFWKVFVWYIYRQTIASSDFYKIALIGIEFR